MWDRRSFVIALGATTALAACGGGPPGPAPVAVNVTGGRGMNPGPDGADRPVTLTVSEGDSTRRMLALPDGSVRADSALGLDVLTGRPRARP